MTAIISEKSELLRTVNDIVQTTPVTDMHTHLYPPSFGEFMLWGVDELVTYHYLIAETMRHSAISYEAFWSLSKREMVNHIWQALFIDHTPYSEACRGVLTTLKELGLNVASRDLDSYRDWYTTLSPEEAVDKVFKKANVESVVMTNDPFDPYEREIWLSGCGVDPRFHAALRIDPLLNDWPGTCLKLKNWGYDVHEDLSRNTFDEISRFLLEWSQRMKAQYMAISLPIDFSYPGRDDRSDIIERSVMPVCREMNIPFAMMIGVKRQANPFLKSAGDMGGRADITAVEKLCASFPDNRFFVTMLSRENQHELAVLARKFRNLMVFGCWWFMNNPSLVEEITTMRFELLGTSVIPQHSDARILDQLIYKWKHSRQIIARVLTQKYEDILDTGWKLERHEIERDVGNLLSHNFWRFVKGK